MGNIRYPRDESREKGKPDCRLPRGWYNGSCRERQETDKPDDKSRSDKCSPDKLRENNLFKESELNTGYVAVIPAAGLGKRMGYDYNKVFIQINGMAIIQMTIEQFEKDRNCDAIYLAARKEEMDSM